MKNSIILFIAFLFSVSIEAQDFKFGKVSKAELAEKIHPIDSSANAAILYKKEDVSFTYIQGEGFIQSREVHTRIKIYNNEGYDWATKKIFLYRENSGTKEKSRGIKGATYNLVDGKIVKDKLKNDGIFEEESNEFTEVTTLTMPNIQDGCVVEYTYRIESPYLAIDDVILQYSIPVNKIDVQIATPQYLAYNRLLNPKAFYYPKITEKKIDRLMSTSTKSRDGWTTVSTTVQNRIDKYFDNALMISETNVPAIKAEAFAGNIGNYTAKLTMEFSAFMTHDGRVEKSYSTNWEKVSKSIYESDNFGRQIKRDGFFEDDISPLVEGISDPFQKAVILQSFVKAKVKWNSLYGYFTQKGIRSAYKEGEGNVADVNLLLVAMLKSQGVNANPVLISSRNNGIPLFPTRKGFNYVVCMVENGENYILLDATEQYSMLNVLPERALNWKGRYIKEDGKSGWVSIKPGKQSAESTSLNVKIEDDFSITGKVRQNFTSNIAMSYRKRYGSLSKDDQIKRLEDDKDGVEISALELENVNDISKPLKLSYDYELSDAVDDIGGKLYFTPLLFLATEESPFKLDERLYPIDFVIPFMDKYMVNVMLPQGYSVESMPQSGVYEFRDGNAKFSFISKQNGNFLQFIVTLDIKSPLILPEDYKAFKEFFEMTVQKQAEQVVLTKA